MCHHCWMCFLAWHEVSNEVYLSSRFQQVYSRDIHGVMSLFCASCMLARRISSEFKRTYRRTKACSHRAPVTLLTSAPDLLNVKKLTRQFLFYVLFQFFFISRQRCGLEDARIGQRHWSRVIHNNSQHLIHFSYYEHRESTHDIDCIEIQSLLV